MTATAMPPSTRSSPFPAPSAGTGTGPPSAARRPTPQWVPPPQVDDSASGSPVPAQSRRERVAVRIHNVGVDLENAVFSLLAKALVLGFVVAMGYLVWHLATAGFSAGGQEFSSIFDALVGARDEVRDAMRFQGLRDAANYAG